MTITDEELDAASEETLENVVEETEETVETKEAEKEEPEKSEKEEPDENKKPEKDEKSKLAELEEENHRLRSAMGRLQSMQSKIDSLEAKIASSKVADPDMDEEHDKLIATRDDVLAVLKEAKETESRTEKQYVDTARATLIDVGLQYNDLDDETYVEIHKDAEAKWKRETGDPKLDARINFTEALSRYYKKQRDSVMEKKNPLNKNLETKEEALGGPTETSVKLKHDKVPELDDYAKEFVEKMGMKPETVAGALKGDMPMYLRGGKF